MRKQEIEVFKIILKNKIVYLNVESTDCDGCTSVYSKSFTLMGDFWEWLEHIYEWLEGSFGYSIVTKEEIRQDTHSAGYWGA